MNPAILETNVITYQFPTEGGFLASPVNTIVTVTSEYNMTVNGLKVAVLDDILSTPALEVVYSTTAFPQPGTGQVTIITWVPIATLLTKNNANVATSDNTYTGTAQMNVVVPASNTASGTVDPIAVYPVNVQITTSQNILNSD